MLWLRKPPLSGRQMESNLMCQTEKEKSARRQQLLHTLREEPSFRSCGCSVAGGVLHWEKTTFNILIGFQYIRGQNMKLLSFRIRNFRSIIDTREIIFSRDNITALVGQNESGKSAVLDALATTFSDRSPSLEDFRFGEDAPIVNIRTFSEPAELDDLTNLVEDKLLRENLSEKLKSLDGKLNWRFFPYSTEGQKPKSSYIIEDFDIEKLTYIDEKLSSEDQAELLTKQREQLDKFEDALYATTPLFVPFDEEFGILPNRIDIPADGSITGRGSSAAANYLTIANVDLKTLVKSDTKAQTTILKRANRKITEELRAFWKQNIGEASGIELSCAIHQYASGKEKQGQSFLEFLITDGDNMLHPEQRSRGTRWFISFFLQLRASAEKGSNHFYLLDEPGANLHERAQNDVLELIEKISKKVGVIYSTHSPHLIRQTRLDRIIAAERDITINGNPTKLIGAHSLGAANKDTLSPIFVAMGVSLARQTSIRQENNVILEELSAQYYLKAFWILTNCQQEVHFLAATGASNIPMLANLFLGWGLGFIVVMDDEPTGRGVYKQLKRDLFLDHDEWSKNRLYKIQDCDGIEDIFDPIDYSNIIGKTNTMGGKKNSAWAKANGAAKAIHALKFLHSVENGAITLENLNYLTQERITNVVEQISSRLKNYQATPLDS
jgi:predicted ATP-binding protein involved in virulence